MANLTNLTTFQKKKFERIFSTLYDTNRDGYIEKADFDQLLGTIQKILSWEKDSPKSRNARDTLGLVWDGLKKVADTDNDAKISKEEWAKMWGNCLDEVKKGQFPEWQKRYMELMFDVNDCSGDKQIDLSEYTTFMREFGMTDDECKNAFVKISEGKESINRDEFAALWKVYLTSDDKSLPGNSLFGIISD